MKKISALILFILAIGLNLSAQERMIFNMAVPSESVIPNSLYNNIDFYDSRVNYEYDQVKIDAPSFTNRLNSIVQLSTDSTSQSGTLLLQLRNLDFSETKNGVESHIRMSLYVKKSDDFYFIGNMDANMGYKDVDLLKQVISKNISDFVRSNLTQGYKDSNPYSFDDLGNISALEKGTFKAYSLDKLVDGVYPNFISFVDQNPASTMITPKFKKNELKEVKTPVNGKLKKTNPQDVYAVVVDGQPYIATDKKFIPLYFENQDYFFEDNETVSRMSFAPSFSIGAGSGGYRGGGIGLGVMNQQKKVKISFMIDHLTGKFIAVNRR